MSLALCACARRPGARPRGQCCIAAAAAALVQEVQTVHRRASLLAPPPPSLPSLLPLFSPVPPLLPSPSPWAGALLLRLGAAARTARVRCMLRCTVRAAHTEDCEGAARCLAPHGHSEKGRLVMRGASGSSGSERISRGISHFSRGARGRPKNSASMARSRNSG